MATMKRKRKSIGRVSEVSGEDAALASSRARRDEREAAKCLAIARHYARRAHSERHHVLVSRSFTSMATAAMDAASAFSRSARKARRVSDGAERERRNNEWERRVKRRVTKRNAAKPSLSLAA